MAPESVIGHIDFHVHTIHSNCGKALMTPTAAARSYQSRGYFAIGFTDHYDPILSPEKMRQTKEELEEQDLDIEIFFGSEVCVYPGWPRRDLRRFRERDLDFCIMSPSHRPSGDEVSSFSRLPIEVQARRVLDSFIEAVRGDFADAIAHPFSYGESQIPRLEEVLSAIDESGLAWALELARDNEVAMEFSPRVLGVPDSFQSKFVAMCKEAGVKFSMGGDAHSLESIGNDRRLIPMIERFGIDDGDIWMPRRA